MGDSTGVPVGLLGDVLVIDVSGGASASTYPVYYRENVDMGRFNCNVYKTDKIVLRKIAAGNYVVGDNSSAYDKPMRTMTTSGFYLGIFPVTQKQYENVTWSTPSYFSNDATGDLAAGRPVEKVS